MLNGKYQCHMAESCTHHLLTIISWLLNRSHIKRPNSQQKCASFLEKVRRMDYQLKNDQTKKKSKKKSKRVMQISCTPIIASLYHLASGFISSKLT